MHCKNCNNEFKDDAKFCNICGKALESKNQQSVEYTNKTESFNLKKTSSSILLIIIFIAIFAISRWASQEGTSAIIDKYKEEKTESKVTNYFTDKSSWKEFNSTLGNFQASFPVYPTHETEPLSLEGYALSMEMYGAEESNGNYYFINFTTYPAQVDTSIPENNLEGSVNGTVQSIDGSLFSSKFIYLGSHKAIEYLIYKKDGSAYIKGRNIMVGQTLYQIGVVYEPVNSSNVQFDKFVNSFQLK